MFHFFFCFYRIWNAAWGGPTTPTIHLIFLISSNPIQSAEGYNQRRGRSTKSKQTSNWIPFTNFLNNGEQSFSLKISMSPIIREVKRLRWAGSLRIPAFAKIFAGSNLGMLTDNYEQVLAGTRHLTGCFIRERAAASARWILMSYGLMRKSLLTREQKETVRHNAGNIRKASVNTFGLLSEVN